MVSIFHKIKRKFGMCLCRSKSDDTGCWAECVVCGEGRENTFISHEIMQSYADLMDAHRKHNELVASMKG